MTVAEVIGEILPLAFGIAISPVPIIANILMLLAPKARAASIGFLAGWVTGVVATITAFALLSSILPESDADQHQPVAGLVKIALGAGLIALALRQWQARPRDGAEPELPGWMAAVDEMSAGRALTIGVLLSSVNPKNLLLGASAGVALGTANLAGGSSAIVVAVFAAIASCTVAVPVVAYLVAAEAMTTPLQATRRWLVENNATVMSVLLAVIGVVVIGKGIASL